MTRDDSRRARPRGPDTERRSARRTTERHRHRHAVGPVRSRVLVDLVGFVRRWKLVAVVGAACPLAAGAALASAAAIAASNGSAPTRASATRGVTTQIVLAGGNYRYCLDDYQQGKAIGTKVVLWRCDANDRGQQWVFYSDSTIRPTVAPGKALGVAADGGTVLKATDAASTRWTYHANGAMRDEPPSGSPSVDEPALNDPGGTVGDGVQLLSYRYVHTTSNAAWWVAGADYASTSVVRLPDAGLKGGTWAHDTGTELQSLVYLGRSRSGAYSYEYAWHMLANFSTVPGAPQPNGTSTSVLIGDTLTGWTWGWSTATITATMRVSRTPSPNVDGTYAPAELRPRGFFPVDAHVTVSGPSGYSVYISKTDTCGKVETMTVTEGGGRPGHRAARTGDGNIAAYAVRARADVAGAQYCGEPGTGS